MPDPRGRSGPRGPTQASRPTERVQDLAPSGFSLVTLPERAEKIKAEKRLARYHQRIRFRGALRQSPKGPLYQGRPPQVSVSITPKALFRATKLTLATFLLFVPLFGDMALACYLVDCQFEAPEGAAPAVAMQAIIDHVALVHPDQIPRT